MILRRLAATSLAALLLAGIAPVAVFAAEPQRPRPQPSRPTKTTPVSVTLSATDPDSDPIVDFDVTSGPTDGGLGRGLGD